MNATVDMNRLFGKTVLWVGNEAEHWSIADFQNAARVARALGFDSICPKRADGTIRWYGTPAQLAAEAHAVRAEGCGYLPFLYAYGPKFGDAQVRGECQLLVEMAEAIRDAQGNAYVQADMEAEWNGQVAAAQLFCDLMRPQPMLLSISTWADPAIQDWDGVAAALAPCVNAWTPQRYTDWLAHQPLPTQETTIQPGVDMSQEFGPNNPLSIAQGQPCVFVWERVTAQANETLARAICARDGGTPPPPPPPPPPGGDGWPKFYTVQSHDSLWLIAAREYGNGADWPTIYAANRDAIGPDPDIIRVGMRLEILAPPAA